VRPAVRPVPAGEASGAEFDAFVCVGPAHFRTALLAIRALVRHAGPRRVFVATSRAAHARLEGLRAEGVDLELLDEDALLPGVTLGTLSAYLGAKGSLPRRAGWYLQQFLKMSACRLESIADHYLVLDADTVLLRPVRFIRPDGAVLVNPASERHAPYFATCRALLGLERQVDFSFIAESLMVRRDYMRALLAEIDARPPAGRAWPLKVMDAIDPGDLCLSGFSEYETYGNWVAARHPGHFVVRPLRTRRDGSKRFGMSPSRYDLHRLSLTYSYVSFEEWTCGRPHRIVLEKVASAVLYGLLHPATPWARALARRS